MEGKIGSLAIDLQLISNIKQGADQVQRDVQGMVTELKAQGQQTQEAYDKMNQTLGKVSTSLDNFSNKANSANTELKKTDDNSRKAGKGMDMLGFNMFLIALSVQQLTGLLQKFNATLINFAKTAVQSFAQIEASTGDLISSMGATGSTAQEMEQAFLNLSLIIPLTAQELSNIAQQVSDAGVKSEGAILAMTVAIGKLSVVFNNIDPTQLSTQVLELAKNFQLSAAGVESIASVFIGLNREFGGTFEEYSKGLNSISKSNKNFKIEADELSVVLAALVDRYGNAQEATGAFNDILGGLSENAGEVAETLGISTQALAENLEGDSVQVITDYIENLNGIESQADKNKTAFEDFGEKGGQAILELSNNVDALSRAQEIVNEEMTNGQSFLDDYQRKSQDLSATWKIFNNTVSVLQTEIGRELFPYIIKFIQILTRAAQTLIAIWRSLSPETKTLVIGLTVGIIVLGMLAGVISTVVIVISALVVGFIALAGAIGSAIGAAFLLVSVAGAVVVAVLAILAAIAALAGYDFGGLGIGDKIRNWLGLDKLSSELDKAKKDVEAYGDAMNKTFADDYKSAGKSIANLTELLNGWSNTFLGDYVYKFTQADWQLLDSVTEIAEQHFDILERAGALSAQQAVTMLGMVRGEIGQAIFEMSELGSVTKETFRNLELAVGADRAASILEEIQQGVKVNELQEALDQLTDQISNIKDQMKKEVDIIDREIESLENIFEGQLEPHEDNLDNLERQKDLLERQYRQEIRAYEDRADAAQELLELERDQLDQVKEINEAELEILEEEEDAARDRLDDAKDMLKELKKLRDKEVDAAEGMVDFAKMNLEAAQNRLERERLLGRDEFDATYRAALERVEAAEQQVDLANDTYIRTKRAYGDEINAAEDKVSIEEEALDAIKRNIEALKDIHEVEEDYYRDRIELAEDEYKLAKDALDDFKDLYQDQKDVLEDQIYEEKFAIKEIQRVRDEQLDILKEERDNIRGRYQAEIDLLEEKQSSAEEALEKERDYLYTIQRLNDEYIKEINDRLSAAEKQVNQISTNFGAGGGNLDNLFEGASIDIGLNLPSGEEIKQTLANWGNIFVEKGKLQVKEIWARIWNFDNLFDYLTEEIQDGNVTWSDVMSIILKLMFFPAGYILDNILKSFGIGGNGAFDWDKDVKSGIVDKVKSITWSDILRAITGGIFGGKETFDENMRGLGGEGVENFKKGISNKSKGVGASAEELFGEARKNLSGNDKQKESRTWGERLSSALSTGISFGKFTVSTAAYTIANSISKSIWSILGNAYSWGASLITSLASGITNNSWRIGSAVSGIAGVIKSWLGVQSPTEKGPLRELMEWMPNMMDSLATGIRSGNPLIASEVGRVASILAGVNTQALATVGADFVTNNARSATSPTQATLETLQAAPVGGDEFHFHAGVIAATEGEMREFARGFQKYVKNEDSRAG